MDVLEWFHILVRWAHFVSAAAWVGGSLFWLFVLRPAAKGSEGKTQSLMKAVANEFRSLVNTCIFVLLATGAIMTFDKLAPGLVGISYVAVLGMKIASVALMFYLIRAGRHTPNISSALNQANEPKKNRFRIIRLLSGYNLVVL
ncbi:uncharacterized protein METZ01_LOCUS219899, partial [marine metagenome]